VPSNTAAGSFLFFIGKKIRVLVNVADNFPRVVLIANEIVEQIIAWLVFKDDNNTCWIKSMWLYHTETKIS
jgi:hypothetical protein